MLLDAHVHIFPPEFIARREELARQEPFFAMLYADPHSPMVSHNELLRDMDDGGIDMAWAAGFAWQRQANARAHNRYLLSVTKEHPRRLRCFAAFWPLAPWAGEEAALALEQGMHGLGELAFYGQDIDLASMRPLCRLGVDHNVPLMLHINEPLGRAYAGKAPMGLSLAFQLLREHPDCKIIFSHLGGGIFFYQTMVARQIGAAFSNLWLDSAALPYLYKPRAVRLAVELLGPEKILLASDYPLLSLKRTCQVVREAGLSPAELELLCGGAALKLLA